ncbi:unnamed protein product [Nesidiocoris tenuis]|uniref:Uncharacterized protein n=1 Tax=Nesidiocoris tenuis TaxID=355587 RepID=A0A6H5GCN1_9HEMI|nr:unnamed protein product [Nesidiocoris tenuis]
MQCAHEMLILQFHVAGTPRPAHGRHHIARYSGTSEIPEKAAHQAFGSEENQNENGPDSIAVESSGKVTSFFSNKKIKLEPPEIPSKKITLEQPEMKKSRSDSTDSRKSKTDSVDSLIRKIKVERECPSPKRVKLEPIDLPIVTSSIKVEPITTTVTSKTSVGSMTPISSLAPSSVFGPILTPTSCVKPNTPSSLMPISSIPTSILPSTTSSAMSPITTVSSTPVASVGSMTSVSSLTPLLSSSLSTANAQTSTVFPSSTSTMFPTSTSSLKTLPRIMTPTPRAIPPMPRNVTLATLSDLDGYDMMDLPVDIDETPHHEMEEIKPHPELTQDVHACFFSLIRDILLSTPHHRIEISELEKQVKAWASSPIGPLNPWYSPQLENQLSSAVLFLAGDPTDSLPEEYVPYMEWKSQEGAYQWIGAGRDSDHHLTLLCNLWLERGAERSTTSTVTTTVATTTSTVTTSSTGSQAIIMPELPPRGPAVRPTSPRKKELFRHQEKERYETPQKAFAYSYGGNDCTVGPVRSMQAGSNASKARGHTLLVEDRPKHITIFELVRDAVARCPNSQGTRADIVTLLKDSQYLLENAPEPVLSSAVSSALDRLHYEHDPIVKYDTKRKIWMYLHKGRSLEEHAFVNSSSCHRVTGCPHHPHVCGQLYKHGYEHAARHVRQRSSSPVAVAHPGQAEDDFEDDDDRNGDQESDGRSREEYVGQGEDRAESGGCGRRRSAAARADAGAESAAENVRGNVAEEDGRRNRQRRQPVVGAVRVCARRHFSAARSGNRRDCLDKSCEAAIAHYCGEFILKTTKYSENRATAEPASEPTADPSAQTAADGRVEQRPPESAAEEGRHLRPPAAAG